MGEVIADAYKAGGLQLAVICALCFVIVVLYREVRKLNSQLIQTARLHTRHLVGLLLKLKTIKRDSIHIDDNLTSLRDVEEISKRNLSLYTEVETSVSDIEALLKGANHD
jgi:hypothetical protein